MAGDLVTVEREIVTDPAVVGEAMAGDLAAVEEAVAEDPRHDR
jgi:hypothetical protein